MHIITKSNGYPGLYEQDSSYSFESVNDSLLFISNWKKYADDLIEDGDIPNWPDLQSLSWVVFDDTLWLRFKVENYLDINEPMVSIAFENESGEDWYGTVKDFRYKEMILAGYYRKGLSYQGYNTIGDNEGVCELAFDLSSNSLFLGVPIEMASQFQNKRFVASIGSKGLWNDDLDQICILKLN